MSKELESWNKIGDTLNKYCNDKGLKFSDAYNIGQELQIVKKGLERLEAIKNSNPSDAMKCLEKLELLTCDFEWYKDNINTIKQALIILNILKRIIKVKPSDLYEFELVIRGTDEEENTIKEWLEKNE